MQIMYRFYKNAEGGEAGSHHPMIDGHRQGDMLALAYQGNLEIDEGNYLKACEQLFDTFNINQPSDYRGLPMNVGDVIAFYPNSETLFFTCESRGFKQKTGEEIGCPD